MWTNIGTLGLKGPRTRDGREWTGHHVMGPEIPQDGVEKWDRHRLASKLTHTRDQPRSSLQMTLTGDGDSLADSEN